MQSIFENLTLLIDFQNNKRESEHMRCISKLFFNTKAALSGFVCLLSSLRNVCKKDKRKGEAIYASPVAPQVGFEPTTLRLTAECSAAELLRHFVLPNYNITAKKICQ